MRWTTGAMAAGLLAILLAAGTMAQTADDEWVGTLLVAREELDKGIAQIDRELAAIPERIASDDWRVFRTESGQVVEVDLRVLEEYVPIAQVIAGHPELKPTLLDALEQADTKVWAAVEAAEFVGGIENMAPADVMGLVRTFYTQSAGAKRDAYATHQARLQAERDDLARLRADIQRELDALARVSGASPSPEASADARPEPSTLPSPIPDVSPEPSLEPSASPSAAPSPCPEGDMWCQDDGASPRPSTLPSAAPEPSALPSAAPSPTPAEPTPGEVDGVQYDALEGLTACAEDDPACGTIGALMTCAGDELGCYTPTLAPEAATGLWSTGIFDGDFEGWGVTADLEQVGTDISGTVDGRNGPIEIVAEEVRRNRVEGHYFGEVYWNAGRDDGRMGPADALFDGCPEPRNGTTHWGDVTIEPSGIGGDREPQSHLTIEVRPCDQAWREDNPAYDNATQWLVDGARTPPAGFEWAEAPVDGDRPWSGEWLVDLGSMRIEQQADHLVGVILSPGGSVAFEADPMDPALAGDLYDPAVTKVGQWQGDAFASWLAGFGDLPADWQCPEPRGGSDHWGDILLQIGGYDGDVPNRVDAAWLPCDAAWRASIGYDEDGDWWYDGGDRFTGWRLRPAAASD